MSVSEVTDSSALSGGNITNNGGSVVTERGVVWSTSSSPTLEDASSTSGDGSGSFNSKITGLSEKTTYYVRAYATNSQGTSYGNEVSFKTFLTHLYGAHLNGEGLTDVDGNIYTSVIIGEQEWMAENLHTTRYADGISIPNSTDSTQWRNLTTGARCYYNNDGQNDSTYGKLYNWYTVETKKLCPTGWHVPADLEWTELTDYLSAFWRNGTEGSALKSTSGWNDDYYGNGTDSYGWLGLPGGSCSRSGKFYSIGASGTWWSSSEDGINYSWGRSLSGTNGSLVSYHDNKRNGFSVRCLRD